MRVNVRVRVRVRVKVRVRVRVGVKVRVRVILIGFSEYENKSLIILWFERIKVIVGKIEIFYFETKADIDSNIQRL